LEFPEREVHPYARLTAELPDAVFELGVEILARVEPPLGRVVETPDGRFLLTFVAASQSHVIDGRARSEIHASEYEAFTR
jgi:hypothetical protein